ncbi:MAG: HEAT repeat domain-containing protein [Candidatus Kapaibacteriales bacterium]
MNLEEIKKDLQSTETEKVKDALYFILDNPLYDNELVKLLTSLITSTDRGIRNLAIDCLLNIPDEFKSEASKYIVPLVESDEIEFRNIAADILVHYKDNCYNFLKQYLFHPIADVRQFALDIWGNIGSRKDWEVVVKLLADPSKNVVISAIIALGNIKLSEVVELLIEKYFIDDEYKPFVLNSLGKIGSPKATNFLKNVINTESDFLLQIAAIEAFSSIDSDENFVNELLTKLPSIPKPMQPYYLKAICNVAKNIGVDRRIPQELRTIALEALREEDLEIRKSALMALGKSYEAFDVDYLIIETFRLEAETIEWIVNNIMQYSPDSILADFIEKIVFMKDNGDLFPILLDIFYKNWETYVLSKKLVLMTTILSLVDDIAESILNDFCDMFVFLDTELFSQSIQKVKSNSIFASNQKLNELIQMYGLF